MSKPKKIEELKKIDSEKKSKFEDYIEKFIDEKDSLADLIDNYEDMTIPVMMRLERYDTALLDHLAERWKTTRSNLAKELLTQMIFYVFKKSYEDKTNDELNELQHKIRREFEEKLKKKKKEK